MFFTDQDFERADWPLLRNGPVTLFWRKRLFEAAKAELRALGYQLIEVAFTDMEQFRRELSNGLKWRELFGYEPWTGNLDALADGFHEVPNPDSPCLAICIEDFHELARRDGDYARKVLDVIADGSRWQALQGRRLLVVAQTNDAEYECADLGGTQANWNMAEWFNEDRGRH